MFSAAPKIRMASSALRSFSTATAVSVFLFLFEIFLFFFQGQERVFAFLIKVYGFLIKFNVLIFVFCLESIQSRCFGRKRWHWSANVVAFEAITFGNKVVTL